MHQRFIFSASAFLLMFCSSLGLLVCWWDNLLFICCPYDGIPERRIEAHVCICFVAYKVYKELERLIKEKKIPLSVDKVLDIAKTITTIRVKMPENGRFYTKKLFLTDRHRAIQPLFALIDQRK